MENNFLGKMMQRNCSFGSIDLEGSTGVERTMVQTTIGKENKSKCVNNDEDDADCNVLVGEEKKAIAWQRVKWTDEMVKLLITAVSYIGEEVISSNHNVGSKRKSIFLHKKGKWKSISKVMAERGHFVSPQQCEDKFNDLNKRYKRLNEILGRGTSCDVVEKPYLLDTMDHISEKAKEEVRKILCSKHLHYEEMCSYHNGNQLHLPPDPLLQRSLQFALGSKNERRKHMDEDDDELDDHDDDYEEDQMAIGIHGGIPKRLRPISEDVDLCNQRTISLEEQKLQIQVQMLELERERFNWKRYNWKKDREIEMMKMENERMKLENERLALEMKRNGS